MRNNLNTLSIFTSCRHPSNVHGHEERHVQMGYQVKNLTRPDFPKTIFKNIAENVPAVALMAINEFIDFTVKRTT